MDCMLSPFRRTHTFFTRSFRSGLTSCVLTTALAATFSRAVAGAEAEKAPAAGSEINGAYYAWQKTQKPESPWRHDYSQTLVMKMYLCSRNAKGKVAKVYLTFEDAFDVIRQLDNLTLGVPKIVYLVGWQFSGHDSGYPAWSVVNESLKRREDPTALDSLKWLMAEAHRYHTDVSLHINMLDAYQDSPLWRIYDERNVIVKDENGVPIKGPVFGGMQSYPISYAEEWRTGLAQKRIDGLVQMLPELKESGSIHIDAFESVSYSLPKSQVSDPFLHLTIHDETEAQRRIIRYWRTQGIDVTTNHAIDAQREDPYIGLVPLAWGFYAQKDQLKKLPWIGKPAGFEGLPANLYTGSVMPAENDIRKDSVHLGGLLEQFCRQFVPWYDQNNLHPGVLAPLPHIRADTFLPVLWRPGTLVACSTRGYESKRWALPAAFAGVTRLKRTRISMEGLKPEGEILVNDRYLTLSLKAGEAIVLER